VRDRRRGPASGVHDKVGGRNHPRARQPVLGQVSQAPGLLLLMITAVNVVALGGQCACGSGAGLENRLARQCADRRRPGPGLPAKPGGRRACFKCCPVAIATFSSVSGTLALCERRSLQGVLLGV